MARPCEYVIMFKPLWALLTLFAAWPQRVTKGGRLVRSLYSPRSVLTAVLYVLSCWRSWEIFLYHLQFDPAGNVPLGLLNAQFLVYVTDLGILTGFILETGRNARYAARWAEFQPQLQRVCGRRMANPGLRRRLKLTALALSVGWPLAIIVSVMYAGEDSHVTLAEILYQSYGTTVLTFASTNWRMHCAFLRHASAMLVDAFTEAVQRDTLTKKDVARFVRTWLQLRELVQEGVDSVGATAFLNIVTLTLTLLLCTFNTMYVVFNGFSKLGIFLSAVGFLTGLTLTRIFNAAHRVNEELHTRIVLALGRAKVSHFPKETLLELNAFRLVLLAHPVKVTLLGFLPINRSVFGALMVTMSTYLVVLIQFSVG